MKHFTLLLYLLPRSIIKSKKNSNFSWETIKSSNFSFTEIIKIVKELNINSFDELCLIGTWKCTLQDLLDLKEKNMSLYIIIAFIRNFYSIEDAKKISHLYPNSDAHLAFIIDKRVPAEQLAFYKENHISGNNLYDDSYYTFDYCKSIAKAIFDLGLDPKYCVNCVLEKNLKINDIKKFIDRGYSLDVVTCFINLDFSLEEIEHFLDKRNLKPTQINILYKISMNFDKKLFYLKEGLTIFEIVKALNIAQSHSEFPLIHLNNVLYAHLGKNYLEKDYLKKFHSLEAFEISSLLNSGFNFEEIIFLLKYITYDEIISIL